MMSCISIFSISCPEYSEVSRERNRLLMRLHAPTQQTFSNSIKLIACCVMWNPSHQQEIMQMMSQTKRTWDNYNHQQVGQDCIVAPPTNFLMCWRGLLHHVLQPHVLLALAATLGWVLSFWSKAGLGILPAAISKHHCSWIFEWSSSFQLTELYCGHSCNAHFSLPIAFHYSLNLSQLHVMLAIYECHYGSIAWHSLAVGCECMIAVTHATCKGNCDCFLQLAEHIDFLQVRELHCSRTYNTQRVVCSHFPSSWNCCNNLHDLGEVLLDHFLQIMVDLLHLYFMGICRIFAAAFAEHGDSLVLH